MFALQNKQISKKQYHEAYIIAHQLMIEIEENFSDVRKRLCVVIIRLIIRLKRTNRNVLSNREINIDSTDVRQIKI